MVAIAWLDSDSSSLEDEKDKVKERVNFCLMEKDGNFKVTSNLCDISYDDQDEYDYLYAEFEKLALKYKVLRKKAMSLNDELEKITYDFNYVFEQRNIFQIELELSKTDFESLKQELESNNEPLQKALNENVALKISMEEISKLKFDKEKESKRNANF